MNEVPRQKRSFVMVRIPAGEFVMGSAFGHGEPDELPAHRVWVDEFLIGRNPVTAAEWAQFLNSLGRPAPEYFEASKQTTVVFRQGKFYPLLGCADHPANGVTWFGAESFCMWLAEKTKRPYRLPTEAEWEKAARGGLESQYYPWGNSSPESMAQFSLCFTEPRLTLSPVGSYPPNGYGLCDVVGNVWEWCSDWYGRNYYHDSPRENPRGPDQGELKVLRGGSWGGLDVQIRCGIRVGERPDISESNVGFRLARSV